MESDENNNENDSEINNEVELGFKNLFLAVLIFSTNIILSIYFELGLNRKLITATLRCIIQLYILSLILNPVFSSEKPWLVLFFSFTMILVASIEVMSRPSYSYTGMYRHLLIAIGGSSTLVMAYMMSFVIPWTKVTDEKWYAPQYLIPILGMLLGNTISGLSLGLTTVLEELAAGKERVEMFLAVGANRIEATKGVVQRSLYVALIPMINQMSVVGIVSIPGMMTGQILAGTPPLQAGYYQMIILFLIGSTTSFASIIAILSAVCWVVDKDHRLRSERIHSRNRPAGVEVWAIAHTMKAIERMKQLGKRLYSVGRLSTRRSWYEDAPNIRSWGLPSSSGGGGNGDIDDLDTTSIGALIGDSEMGSDDVFSTSVLPSDAEHHH